MVEKLVARMIKNIHVEIKRIHVRYEDHVTFKDHPFSVGFTLNNFILGSCTDSWETNGNLKDMYAIPQIYKVGTGLITKWRVRDSIWNEKRILLSVMHTGWIGSLPEYNCRTI